MDIKADYSGQEIGKYYLVQKLGNGGFGAVYRAHDRILKTDKAIKILEVKNPREAYILFNEAAIPYKCRHNHIIKIKTARFLIRSIETKFHNQMNTNVRYSMNIYPFHESWAPSLIAIWNEAKLNGIDEASLLEYVEDTAALLEESQRLNFLRWPILDQWVHMNFQALGSYEAEVGTVKKYIKERIPKLDELLNNY